MKSSLYIDSDLLDSITTSLVNGFNDKCLDLSVVYQDCLHIGCLVLLGVHSDSLDYLKNAFLKSSCFINSYEDISSDRVDFDSDDIPFVNSGSDI